MRIVGLDLSLTSSGVAPEDGEPYRVKTKASMPLKERLRFIADEIAAEVDGKGPSLALVEEVPTHAAFNITTLAKVHGAVLYAMESPILYVSAPSLKKYGTGKGNAKKDAVLADAIRRFNYMGTSNDEADAWILLHMGLDLMGRPRVKVPEVHRDALKKLELPEDVEPF